MHSCICFAPGWRDGVNAGVNKGAKENGGTTIGILPGLDSLDSNQYVDIPICTGLGNGRNLLVIRAGEAIIAIGGAYGTLSEISYAFQLEKPVVGLNSWNLSGLTNVNKPSQVIDFIKEHI